MKLDEIKTDSEVFVDSNIFIYHFTGVSDECGNFLNRCEQRDLTAITSVNVILEVLHRLMMVEAVKKNLVKPPNIVRKLNESPKKIKALNEYFLNTQKINEMGVAIRPVTFETVMKSHMVRMTYGLMVNDSIIAASMQEEGLNLLATNDTGFEKVDEILVYSPEDVDL